ncbi:ROK family protein [Novosphingobium rosa]|uniref:ROK family protein n=1 Tax=Novosphingobium rosa TaxID=76978 RepID=UPI00082DF18E|nr:ROK family protein [Novosphingobium rosa]
MNGFRAGVELGGTKTIAVIGRGQEIVERITFPTTTPEATLGAVAGQLAAWHATFRPEALGIASFGPIALNARHGAHGHMLPTPKAGWSGADVLGILSAAMPVPVALHTDVTAAALAEQRWGAARGLSDIAYITIGTGIGMGVIAGGQPVTGRMHPEAGHLRVRRLPGDRFAGVCSFHGDCLEGLASGPAIAARAGMTADLLPEDHPAWLPVTDALAEGIATLMLTLSCERIVIGGGVGLGRPHLLPLVRGRIAGKLGGYLPSLGEAEIAALVVPAALGGDAGPLGTLALADTALPARVLACAEAERQAVR